MYEITKADIAYGRKLKFGAISAPILLTIVPALITFILLLLAASGPPAAAVILFAGVIATIIGFLIGLTLSVVLAQRRATWTRQMRERIAADGIRAEEVDWFRNEMKSGEKRALKAVEASDALLGDAYRDALASRLTATRIVRLSRRELSLAKNRQGSLRKLKGQNADEFRTQTVQDIEKISKINDEAKTMLIESEARLQMIEAAAARGGSLANSELALKKLSGRNSELPLALEAARMTDDIRKELEAEDELPKEKGEA
jgi:hypothetical protein